MISTVNMGYMSNANNYIPSEGSVPKGQSFSSSKVNANRGILAQLFGADKIAKEDFERAEQSADNQMKRDLYLQERANSFSAEEAEKARAYDREMSNSQYTRLVADLKNAGLNPVLALGGSGASFHGGTSASASSARSGSSNVSNGYTTDGNLVSAILGMAAGLIAKMPTKNYKIGF